VQDERVLASELLAELGPVIGGGDLSYAEPLARLSGGFFTENYGFRLAGAPPPWDGRLVVRLFPVVVDDDAVRREAVVQRELAAVGFPTPAVLHFNADAHVDGRRYFVMERMPGAPLMGGIRFGALLRDGPRLLPRLVHVTAEVQAELHGLDPAPVTAALGGTSLSIDRWFAELERLIDRGGDGFATGLAWLVEHRPVEPSRPTLCHGDLHPGNILVGEDGKVTAVLDWTVATLAEPALDVGFTTMALSLAPVDIPRPFQKVVARFGRGIANRYVRAYRARTAADLSTQPYYEALRCALEVGNAAYYRLAAADGRAHEQPRPPWDRVADAMVGYFRVRTGVDLRMPAPVPAS
jgi:aminoglycoside phosphotransferase (APT) family kinase protein